MERWLVLSNCQTFGVRDSMRLLSPHIEVEAADIWMFKNDIEFYRQEIPKYFRVIIHPQFRDLDFDFSVAQNLSILPSINFDAYHPDLCYAFSNGPLDSPIGAYHSMIVLAAFDANLSVVATRKLFRREIYEACGFLTRWEEDRAYLMRSFAIFGLDISAPFRRWARGGSFMYSVNHAKIQPLYDISRVMLEQLGIKTYNGNLLPIDSMVNGACYPVYPEVGEHLGAPGSYLFKMPNEYRMLSLEKFIELSFAAYAKVPKETILVEHSTRIRYERVKAVIADWISSEPKYSVSTDAVDKKRPQLAASIVDYLATALDLRARNSRQPEAGQRSPSKLTSA